MEALQAEGATVLWLPALEIGPPEDLGPLDSALRRLERFDWAIFTSQHAVHALARRLSALGLAWGQRPRAAAVGEKTAVALSRLGCSGVLVPPDPTGLGLARALRPLGPRHVLWPRARLADERPAQWLREAGVEVEEVVAYQAIVTGADSGPVHLALASGALEAVIFTSPRTVAATLELLGPAGSAGLAKLVRLCIGPVTAAACERLGLGAPLVADERSVSSLVARLATALAGPQKPPPDPL